jgi:hypothetical protein
LRRTAKHAYAAAVWAGLFALVSFYWAAGGETGLETLAVEIERDALARDGGMVALTWITGALKIVGVVVALGLAACWEPRRLFFWAGLGGGLLIAVYGAAGIIEKLLIKLDVNAANASLGDDRVGWYLFLWDPFWMLGGVLFILAALEARPAVEKFQ